MRDKEKKKKNSGDLYEEKKNEDYEKNQDHFCSVDSLADNTDNLVRESEDQLPADSSYKVDLQFHQEKS